jgi:hypothetical protein
MRILTTPATASGAVHRRGAVEQQVVLLHQRRRHQAEVGGHRRAFDTGRRHAATIDQHQRAGRAQATQVDRGRARAIVEDEALESQIDLLAAGSGRFLQDVAGVDQPDFARHLAGDYLQWRDTGIGITLEPRSRDNDFLGDLLVLIVLSGCVTAGLLGERCRRHDQHQHAYNRKE